MATPHSLNDPFEFVGAVKYECSRDERKTLLDLVARKALKLSEETLRVSEPRRESMSDSDFWMYLLSLENMRRPLAFTPLLWSLLL